jgi:hypothetical protein
MKMIADFLEHARQFERLAQAEEKEQLKGELLKQAEEYRKLASKRAAKLGLPHPKGQPTPQSS